MSSQSRINLPKISVVMPVYNADKYLKLAIDSILKQTFSDFEFIIINDGSTDKTEEIINSYNDPRIVPIHNYTNSGLSYSLNIGINKALGEYIARMDADDISTPNRFKEQLEFMEEHPDVGIVGSPVVSIDEKGKTRNVLSRPTRHTDIKWSSLFSTPMYHPTIMAKASILKENRYNPDISNSEDYELWSRLLFTSNIRFANLKKPILYYRSFTNSTTQQLNPEKKILSANNAITNIEHYIPLNDAEKVLLLSLYQGKTLSLLELLHHWYIYFRAARSFSIKEKLNYFSSLRIYKKLLSHALFLTKYGVKEIRKSFS